MACIKLKKLEEYLNGLDSFEKPKIKLEQYITPPHIASCVLYNIQTLYGDIEGKYVADLGCGSGMLSIGSFLLGAGMTVGFEIDDDALNIFRENVTDMELPNLDCVLCDVLTLPNSKKWENAFDTIVTNPPFGTKNNSGIDMCFVQTGITLASGAVYSFHKSSTRDYIQKKVKDWHVKGNVVAELKYNIDTSYSFHKSKSVDINVDFWRFDVSEKNV
ncbi:PREDICTED: methyltransferase-like protein 5 isoform X1 [Rhagoletis zephyria]|uniref:rRNA N6-adenosine-methyltransferase METTL5-like n=1 Tax=Rhagoletis pomonella TaxID=28610 RepID=UPI00081127DC|nr:PREDICTED: methyltransferase-like protein 5 isoform X1 [Rhagoletis zephyria]XP_036336685.1 rRNA N6-adenosine-methyltransferase METTL5-like [Rhagoletis pomonella]